jgi:ParB family transcriptional regulator, chromosome partitioning protein
MRMLWKKTPIAQLDLLDAKLDGASPTTSASDAVLATAGPFQASPALAASTPRTGLGLPLMVPVAALCEVPANPRTEFPDAELEELAQDIRQHGILQPIVVHPADEQGRHRIHFGAKRWRAAQRAGLTEVPVVVRDAPTDPYTQLAENQKRHGLTPQDLARFIRARVDAGESNATIANRMGIDQTTIAHHLSLLDLPPELNEAMQAGRCTSPRTLYELRKLHRDEPERVRALLAGDGDITRSAVSEFRALSILTAHAPACRRAPSSLIAQAESACARLELALDRIAKADPRVADADLEALKQRIASLGSRLE